MDEEPQGRSSDDIEADQLAKTLADPMQPWWWRKLVGPGLGRMADTLNENDPNWQPVAERKAPKRARRKPSELDGYLWEADCPHCQHRVSVLTDGRLCAHYTSGAPVVGGRQKGKCPGTHTRSTSESRHKLERATGSEPRSAFKWVVLAEFVVVVGAGIWLVSLALSDSDADHDKLGGPFWLTVIAAVALVGTLLLWLTTAVPGSGKLIGGAVAAGVVAHAVVEHHQHEEMERTERAVEEALRKHDKDQ